MISMDQVHVDYEHQARLAAKKLQLWLRTISPANPFLAERIASDLTVLAKDLKWGTCYDETLEEEMIQ